MTQEKGGEMMFQRWLKETKLFAPRPAALAGRALCAAVMSQSRLPSFYRDAGAPDTPTGRFELAALHLALAVRRLRGQDPFAAEASQALFDTFLSGLDADLRELGVGDLTVPKTMRRLAEAIYGRFRSLDGALAAPDDAELRALIGRTVLAGATPAAVAGLAAYVLAADVALAATPLDDLYASGPVWPTPRFDGAAA